MGRRKPRPYAILKLHDSVLRTALEAAPLAYLQVIAVDLAWHRLEKAAWWLKLVEKRRGKWAEKLLDSRGGPVGGLGLDAGPLLS